MISLPKGTISLYVKLGRYPGWICGIGLPSSTTTRPTGPYPSVGFADISPSPKGSRPLPPKKGRLTDTEGDLGTRA